MDVSYVFAGLMVADRDKAADWYTKIIGRPADMLPNDAEAAWRLTGLASVYLRADPHRAGRGVLTLVVDGSQSAKLREALTGRGYRCTVGSLS